MNKWIGIGNLIADPELSYSQGKGTPICKFKIAVRRDKENSDFISCVAWNKSAEMIANSFVKGSKIAVTGSIKTGSYDAKDGTKRYTTDVWIETFEFVEKKQEKNEKPAGDEYIGEVDTSDIPFN